MKPRPIDTAPRDGTAINTDCGIACFVDQRNWGSPVPDQQWVLCHPDGTLFRDSDEGYEFCTPKLWTPLARWVNR